LVRASLLGTASILPGRPIPNAELAALAGLDATGDDLEARTGIRFRHHAGTERMADLGARVLKGALDEAGLTPADLRRVIFVSSTGGDCLIPATANTVLEALGACGACDAFDLNNACMGFLTAMDVASRCAATGLAPVGIISVEILSRFLAPAEPRPYLVLGDAAAAAVVGAARSPGEGVLASWFENDGASRGSVSLAHPGLTGKPERITFADSNRTISTLAMDALDRCASRVLDRAGLRLGDVDRFVVHQPNGNLLKAVLERLGIDPARQVTIVDEIGSVGSASIPFGLDRLRRTGGVGPGMRLLLVGVGAGLAAGAILWQVGP
jgi:3-oxoacyl-(acyl-carrier-protein) synthase III